MTPIAAPPAPALAAAVEHARMARWMFASHINQCSRAAYSKRCPGCRYWELNASAADAALEVAREKAGSR